MLLKIFWGLLRQEIYADTGPSWYLSDKASTNDGGSWQLSQNTESIRILNYFFEASGFCLISRTKAYTTGLGS